MPEKKPVVYILRGDDRQAIEDHLDDLYQKTGDPEMAEMNTTRLEGRATSLNDLRAAALAMPFLADRRLVILEDALQSYAAKGSGHEREQFLRLLDSLPQTTGLVLVIPDSQRYTKGQRRWEVLDEDHWLMLWSRNAGSRAFVVDCLLPSERDMPGWIRKKVVEMSGSITPPGAATLADYVGTNTQRAVQEINKLLTYVNLERAITEIDVEKLTVQDRRADIFELVDAIGGRNGQKALDLLRLLTEEMDFGRLFGMIVRQFRLLLQAREIIDDGGSRRDVAKKLHQLNFVADKLVKQAASFDLRTLETIYHQLLEIDLNGKTGQMEADIALDVLVAQLAHQLV